MKTKATLTLDGESYHIKAQYSVFHSWESAKGKRLGALFIDAKLALQWASDMVPSWGYDRARLTFEPQHEEES